MAFDEAKVMPSDIDAKSVQAVALAFSQLAGFIDNPIADVRISAETPTASPRTVTIQVRDRLNNPWPGRWWVKVLVGTTAFDAGGTHTVTWTSGAVVLVLSPDESYLCLTNSDGSLELTLAAAAGTRHFTASVVGRAQSGSVGVT